jgi:NAD(P)-dependent dehydrogenase (short-subunit alcohol dehydrogenase family)
VTKKVILITGASSGIGRACADGLSSRGWTVIGASRRATLFADQQSIVMDVNDDASVNAGVSTVLAEHGQIDAVLACAGWGLAGAAEQTPLAAAKAQFETNFWGAVRVTQAVLPIFRRAGGGRVVLMSSIGGVLGIPFQAFYSASKFALEGYAESLAYEVAPFKIHVSLIEPGNFKTDFTQSRQMVPILDDDPYRGVREKAIEVMERDETNGADPRDVATVVARVLASANPPRRASVGKLDERVGIVGKRLLPFRLFEKAAKGSLGV